MIFLWVKLWIIVVIVCKFWKPNCLFPLGLLFFNSLYSLFITQLKYFVSFSDSIFLLLILFMFCSLLFWKSLFASLSSCKVFLCYFSISYVFLMIVWQTAVPCWSYLVIYWVCYLFENNTFFISLFCVLF